MLPNSNSSKWITFYITPGTKDKARNNEVLQQIINSYPALQTSFSAIKGIFPGSLVKLPIRWSPINLPYLKEVNGTSITIDGFASNMDCTLYWIAVSIERPAYDQGNTVNSSHIRYLVDLTHSRHQ